MWASDLEDLLDIGPLHGAQHNHGSSKSQTNISKGTKDEHEGHGNCTNHRHSAEHWEHAYIYALVSLPFVLIFVGTFGNVVTYLVLKRKSYRKNVMANALRYLCILDLIILWTVVLENGINGIEAFNLLNLVTKNQALICTAALTFVEFITSTGNWIIVLITVTRLIHLKSPVKSDRLLTQRNYYIALIVIHVCSVGTYGTFGLTMYSNIKEEYKTDSDAPCFKVVNSGITVAHLIILMSVAFFIPTISIIVLSILLIMQVNDNNKRKKKVFRKLETGDNIVTPEYHTNNATIDTSQNALGLCTSIDTSQNALGLCTSIDTSQNALGLCTSIDTSQNALGLRTLQFDADQLKSNRSPQSILRRTSALLLNKTCIKGQRSNGINSRKDTQHMTSQNKNLACVPDLFKLGQAEKKHLVDASRHRIQFSKSENSMIANYNRIEIDQSQNALQPALYISEAPNPRTLSLMSNDKTTKQNIVDHGGVFIGVDIVPAVSGAAIKPQRTATNSIASWYEQVTGILEKPIDKYILPENIVLNVDHGKQENIDSVPNVDVVGPCSIRPDTRIDSLTMMVLVASAAFIILNAPFWVFNFFIKPFLEGSHSIGCHWGVVIGDITYLMRLTSHTFNFIFYCITTNRFRREFLIWWRELCCFR